MFKVHLYLSQLFQLSLLFQLFHSLRRNRRNRWNTLPAQPIFKHCHIPFTIPQFHLFLFLKILKKMDFGHLFWNRMISVPFELKIVELGMLIPGIPLTDKSQNECGLNLSPLFHLFLLFHLFHSLRWNRQNRWNTLPVLPISKKCCIPFTIPLFHLFIFLNIVKRNRNR